MFPPRCTGPLCVLVFTLGPFAYGQDSRPTADVEPHEPAEPVRELEVRALANEGFLLRAGDDVVAIDAFVAEPYVGYAALEGDVLAALLDGTGPFDSLDVALSSHYHRDHFQGEPARRFLTARPDCLFVSSPQVVEALRAAEAEGSDLTRATIREVLPDPGEEHVIEVGDLRVEILRISHGTGRFAHVENLGHVITVGGVTALHVGDAAMTAANFAPYELRARGIDVAFVPYWYFGDAAGRRIIDEHFRPARLVACHVPPRELAAVTRALAETDPEVRVPQEPLELYRVRDER